MKLKIIFPIIDFRPFIVGEKNKINYPTWPFPSPREFVKYHGQIKSLFSTDGRKLYYCDAKNVVKFTNTKRLKNLVMEFNFSGFYFTKRLFVIDEIEAYLEVTLNLKSKEGFSFTSNKFNFFKFLKAFLFSQVSMPSYNDEKKNFRLIELSNNLKHLFLKSTTKNSGLSGIENWWVTSGSPFIVFQSSGTKVFRNETVLIRKGDDQDVNISREIIKIDDIIINLWEISYDRYNPRIKIDNNLDQHLIHMSISYESVKSIIKCLIKRRLNLVPESTEFHFFQEHINKLIKKLTKNIDKDESVVNQVRKKTLSYFDLFPESEIEVIVKELSKIRRNVLRRLASFMRDKSGNPQSINSLRLNIKEEDVFTEGNTNFLRNRVFISYSRKDLDIVKRIIVHFKPFSRMGIIDLWSHDNILVGQNIKAEVRNSLQRSRVAILVITADFLASDAFENELPVLLRNAKNKGAAIISLIVKPSAFEYFKDLNEYEPLNKIDSPLLMLTEVEQEVLLVKLAKTTIQILSSE